MTQEEKQIMMFGLVEQWQQSGVSQSAFAVSQGLSIVKFRYWIRKHRQLGQDCAFIQLNGTLAQSISIRYPNGVELNLPAQVPIMVLKSLVSI